MERGWKVPENHGSGLRFGGRNVLFDGGDSACPAARPGRDRIRVKHYSIRTEQSYCAWIKRFIIFYGKRFTSGLGATDVEAFLPWLAVHVRVAASACRTTRGSRRYPQAIAAILRRMNAICVASGRSLGHTSWQARSDMQPNTPSSSPITS